MDRTSLTPMMRQYLSIKEKCQDAILLFRLGDFYEMFFEDAEKASKILDIALTSRNRHDKTPVPLCGVPYHAVHPYVAKLLNAGLKVAICEQVEDPKTARGVVQREVVRVITPGTITDPESLSAVQNNFLMAVLGLRSVYGLSFSDITTGEFRFTCLDDYVSLSDEVARVQPRELIFPENQSQLAETLGKSVGGIPVTLVPATAFAPGSIERLRSAGLYVAAEEEAWTPGLRAAGAILAYLEETAPAVAPGLGRLEHYRSSQYMMLDEATRVNLELLTDFAGGRTGSLLRILDSTRTGMGARELRRWILYPLLDERLIRARQDAIEELFEREQLRCEIGDSLRGMQDLQRLAGRVVSGTASPRDAAALKDCLGRVGSLREALETSRTELLASLGKQLRPLPDMVELLEKSLVEDPPAQVRDGGFIREGFNEELDELRSIRNDAKGWMTRFQEGERIRSGIPSLKVRYNRIFGYYLEVTRAHLKHVPEDYIRKQTMVNGERFITPQLKEYEAKILGSQEEIQKLEAALFHEIRQTLGSEIEGMRETAHGIAVLDVLLALQEAAQTHHFARPRVDSGLALSIREGRHPVVEAALGRGSFVPNDCYMDPEKQQLLLLTGPNMAGKSTYMRQVAIIVLLAQMGSFVPASDASIGLVDRLFTRFGASDFLALGESTFMVEMKETARILRLATPRSLILLDEVGRGTSTFDGISIAWSVAEYLHDSPHRPRTLFATHYHELTNLAVTKERVNNFNFTVKEWQGEVLFLRTLHEGAASRSYGIHVAALAGLPPSALLRAKEILHNLEGEELTESGHPRLAGHSGSDASQMVLFSSPDTEFRQKLRCLDTSTMTPIEALNTLHGLVEEAKKQTTVRR